MKKGLLLTALLVLLGALQYRLWLGQVGLLQARALQQSIADQEQNNAALRERNQALEAEVLNLRNGVDAIEERARSQLGMTKQGETFYLIVDE